MELAGLGPFSWGRLGLVAAAVLAAVVPVSPRAIDRFYAAGLYPRLQWTLTVLSNLVPVALFDLALAGVIGGWVGLAWRDIRRTPGTGRAAASIAARTAAWA